MIQECDCAYYTLLNLPPPGTPGPTGSTGPIGPTGATGPYNFNTLSTNYIANRIINTPNPPLQSVCCDTTDFRTCSILFPALLSLQGIDFWLQSQISTWKAGDKISIQKAYSPSNVVNYTLTANAFYSFSFQVPVVVDTFTGIINNGDEVVFTYIPKGPIGPTGPTGPIGPPGQVLGSSVYGELKTSTITTTKTFAALNSFQGFFNLVTGIFNGVTVQPNPSPTPSRFIVQQSGTYNVETDLSITVTVGGGDHTFQYAPFINNVQGGVGQVFEIGGAIASVPITLTFLANLVVGDVVDMRIAQTVGSLATISISRCNQLLILTSPVQGPIGPTGPTGPQGTVLANGAAYSDYLYWEPTTSKWTPGLQLDNFHLGYNAGLGFKGPTEGNSNTFVGGLAGVVGPGAPGRFDITAVGYQAVNSLNFNGGNNTAVGSHALETLPLADAIAIGNYAGRLNAGIGSVSIGTYLGTAGQQNLGQFSITIGRRCGETNFPAQCIALSAVGTPFNGVAAQTNSFYVNPIRQVTTNLPDGNLWYNSATKEVNYVKNGFLYLYNTTLSNTTTIDTVQGLAADVSQVTINGIGLTSTNITLGGIATVYFSGFVVGQSYLIFVTHGIVHTTANQNRVCRVAVRTTTGTPATTDTILNASITTVFGQAAAIFSNVCWSNQMNGTIFTCATATDKVWFSTTVSVGTVALGGYPTNPGVINIVKM